MPGRGLGIEVGVQGSTGRGEQGKKVWAEG